MIFKNNIEQFVAAFTESCAERNIIWTRDDTAQVNIFEVSVEGRALRFAFPFKQGVKSQGAADTLRRIFGKDHKKWPDSIYDYAVVAIGEKLLDCDDDGKEVNSRCKNKWGAYGLAVQIITEAKKRKPVNKIVAGKGQDKSLASRARRGTVYNIHPPAHRRRDADSIGGFFSHLHNPANV